ncbi:origin recognition complex subunit 5 isoform X2 [Zeugodacus cucurbitae]|uniref:Origin recognition complex subunit 5 n=1 Tax=Zeugodacus cucurbitae TaxID=28588 RepID=A0A0A1WTW4_ZEUCU|nr:origin recognition complex subunit 5 isoform X2 [Zeugodacus cucurbitae]
MEVFNKMNERFPCRKKVLKTLTSLIGHSEEMLPAAIHIYGHTGTGKTTLLKNFLNGTARHNRNKLNYAFVNCVESYTLRILFENILEYINKESADDVKTENLKDFLEQLRHLQSQPEAQYIIVLDNAERLRDMDANVLPSLLRLQQLSGLNICVVLVSQLPLEKFYCKTSIDDPITLYFAQYTKTETLEILSADFKNAQKLMVALLKHKKPENLTTKLQIVETVTREFFNNYLNIFLGVFYKACRDLSELKITARKCFTFYMEPILDGTVSMTDVSRLWRCIAGPLRTALTQVYIRSGQAETPAENNDKEILKIAQSLELPYYGKYLLIAAFIASYNSSKDDKRLFVKNHGKRRKRLQNVNANAKVTEKLNTYIGPKSFSVDRLLAIFYAILEEKVGLTCNLLSQISTLVNLKLLSFVSGENVMDGTSRLQCTVGLDFVICISQVVGFNVRQYLSDFN